MSGKRKRMKAERAPEAAMAVPAGPAAAPVPVAAPPPAPVVRVEPHEDLAAAIASAPPDAWLELAPGTHELRAPLRVSGKLRLRGAGRDQSRVATHAPGVGLAVSGALFEAEDLAFEHLGDPWAHVVQVVDADVRLQRCRFRDARRVATPDLGDGLRLGGDCRGLVRDCEFLDNGQHGLVLFGRADVRIEGCAFRDNHGAGLAMRDQSRGWVLGGVAERNAVGMLASHDAAPRVLELVARANRRDGFAWRDHAGGDARGCTAEENRDGFTIADRARPRLTAPIALLNRETGLRASEQAGGAVSGGRLQGNGTWGALFAGQALTSLDTSVVAGNGRSGLAWIDDALSEVDRCLIERNAAHGAEIHDQARPTLVSCHLRANGWHGVHCSGTSGGRALRNLAERNQGDGFRIAQDAAPALDGNAARLNAGWGFSWVERAGGEAAGNRAADNVAGDFGREPKRPFHAGVTVELDDSGGAPPFVPPEVPTSGQPSDMRLGRSRLRLTPADDLDEVLSTAPEGALLELAPGDYQVASGATRRGDMVLRSVAPAATRLVTRGDGPVLRFEGPGTLVLEGIRLERDCARPGDVLTIAGGEAALTDCVLRGGMRSKRGPAGGHGIAVRGPRRVSLRDTTVEGNQGAAIACDDPGARILIERCALGGNLGGETRLAADGAALSEA